MFKLNQKPVYTKEDMRAAIEENCNEYSKETAISYYKDDDSVIYWTYQEHLDEIKKVNNLYIQMKFKEHDRVAVVMPHSPYAVFAVLGLAYSGAIIVPIDASLPVGEIERLLSFADVAGVFSTETILDKLSEDTKSKYPFGILNKDNVFTIASTSRIIARECDIYDNDPGVLAIIFSSGTTAKMKGICLPYKSILEATPLFGVLIDMKPGTRVKNLYVLPINHVAGFTNAFFFFFHGCNNGMIEKMNSTKLIHTMQVFEPRYFALVPKVFEIISMEIDGKLAAYGKSTSAFIHSMMNFNGFLREHLHINIGKIIFKKINQQVFGKEMWGLGVGATPCKPETTAYFWNLGYNWANFYSSTETGVPAIATNAHDKTPVGIVGKADRFKEIEVKVVSKDVDGIGEICIKSPFMMTGYFREPELTKNAFDKQGFFMTGDLGYIDKRHNLHITGRKKEIILMHNGKKASPEDIEKIYNEKLKNIPFTVCGIPGRDGFDEIHLFAELTNGSNADEQKEKIKEALSTISGIYRVSDVHIVSKLPTTGTGKVKRSQLVQSVQNGTEVTDEKNNSSESSTLEELISSVCSISADTIIGNKRLVEDLGIDSLAMFELVTKIEQQYGINISNQLVKIQTVDDLKRTVTFSAKSSTTDTTTIDNLDDENREHYPKPRNKKQIRRLKYIVNRLPHLYDVTVFNAKRIVPNKPCIICMNHQSYFDGLPAIYLLNSQGADVSKVAYLAAHHLISKSYLKKVFTLIGGIPIDRFVNPIPAYRDMAIWLRNGGSVIIHPEGVLSTDGSINSFKEGAAKLAIENGVPILPVRIDGTFDILPKGATKPILKVNGKKCKIKISVGDYIYPENMNATALTEKLRNTIIELPFNE